MGGQSVMNTEDYVKEVEEMLSATFVDENNEEQRYYKRPIAGMYVTSTLITSRSIWRSPPRVGS